MLPSILFSDRHSAGEQLAQAIEAQLEQIRSEGVSAKPIVYALPRGGLPVAAPVAAQLGCILDIIVAKKITLPEDPELAIGAVTAEGDPIWANRLPLPSAHPKLQQALQEARERASAQYKQLAAANSHLSPQEAIAQRAKGEIAIAIDDGIATGMTIAAAVKALRVHKPAQIWIATPVAPLVLMKFLRGLCDRAIVLSTPLEFFSVSRFYKDFPQVELEVACSFLHPKLDSKTQNIKLKDETVGDTSRSQDAEMLEE